MAVRVRTLETMDTVEDTAGVAEGHDSLASQVVYQLFGAWAGVVTFEATLDKTNWYSTLADPLLTGTLAISTTASGLYRIDASGVLSTRVRFSTDTSGTVSVLTNWVIG